MISSFRMFVVVALVAILAGVCGSAVAGHISAPAVHKPPSLLQLTDFSGYWAHDPAASHVGSSDVLAGLGEGGAPENLFISQARNGALTLSSGHNPSAPRVYQIGGESRVPAPGEQGGMMTVSTRWQESALVTEGSLEGGGGAVRERMSLADDGDTLILEATATAFEAEASSRLVYRRWVSR